MASSDIAPYGSWKSPITAELLATRYNYIDQMIADGNDIYWTEVRPPEKGRFALMSKRNNEEPEELLGPEYNFRTAVHEYGGGAFTAKDNLLFFSNFSDGRIYLFDGRNVKPITEEGNFRYADLLYDSVARRLICIREDHSQDHVINSVISIDIDTGVVQQLASGNDFYSSPKLSPDGKRFAWLTWNHPDMPWDSTELYVADYENGNLNRQTKVAGGNGESIFQPEFSPSGVLHFISDRTGWWNIYRYNEEDIQNLTPTQADFGVPQWRFGLSTYAIESEERIICTWFKDGAGNLGTIQIGKELEKINIPYAYFSYIRSAKNYTYFLAGSPTEFPCVIRYSLGGKSYDVIYRPKTPVIDMGYLSMPRHLEFQSSGGRKAFAYFYECKNRDFMGPSGQKPSLIILCHGGPTSQSLPILSIEIQFWTSRGFSVAQVNYRGSSGYGKLYRNTLYGKWGIVDVEDCMKCAEYLVKAGKADSKKLIIKGGSAGGFTTLSALTFKRMFAGGASYSGVLDPESLLMKTHKFESHYLEKLIGPYPVAKRLFEERSPLKNVKKISAPVALFHGSEDRVVPAAQSEMMYKALKDKGTPVLFMLFEGEGHSFVTSDSIKNSVEAELYFYSKLFGFSPSDLLAQYQVDNLAS